jgi:hypothetical protein
MSFVAITLCVASQRVFVVVYFVIGSVRKLLDTPSYRTVAQHWIRLLSPLYPIPVCASSSSCEVITIRHDPLLDQQHISSVISDKAGALL